VKTPPPPHLGRGLPHELRDSTTAATRSSNNVPISTWPDWRRSRNCEFFEVMLLPAEAQKYGLVADIEVDSHGMVRGTHPPAWAAQDRSTSP